MPTLSSKYAATFAGCTLGLATLVSGQTVVNLNPVADTFVAFRSGNAASDTNFGSSTDLDLHQQGEIFMSAYLRFDLAAVIPANATITSVTLTLTKAGTNTLESGYPLVSTRNDTVTTGRFAAYGLLDVDGNTAQNWGETTLTANTMGAERVATSGLQFDTATRTVSFDEVNESTPGGTSVVVGTSESLVSFVQNRLTSIGGGTATLILDFPTLSTDSARGYALLSREG